MKGQLNLLRHHLGWIVTGFALALVVEFVVITIAVTRNEAITRPMLVGITFGSFAVSAFVHFVRSRRQESSAESKASRRDEIEQLLAA